MKKRKVRKKDVKVKEENDFDKLFVGKKGSEVFLSIIIMLMSRFYFILNFSSMLLFFSPFIFDLHTL